MVTTRSTIMAVHAHPDDECIATGGMLARYSDAGARTVLVTCTDGALGEVHADTGGRPLAEVRADELAAACAILGIDTSHFLGFGDSGMAGTPENEAAGSFHQADLDEATGRLLALFEKERPDVIVTYDEKGLYGHPDHIRAHEVAVRAYHRANGESWAPRKLYYGSIPRSALIEFGKRMRELNPDAGPPSDDDVGFEMGMPDERFTTTLDVGAWWDRKFAALRAHRTQVPEDSWFLTIPEEMARLAFGTEWYILADARIPTDIPEDDLLAGLA